MKSFSRQMTTSRLNWNSLMPKSRYYDKRRVATHSASNCLSTETARVVNGAISPAGTISSWATTGAMFCA